MLLLYICLLLVQYTLLLLSSIVQYSMPAILGLFVWVLLIRVSLVLKLGILLFWFPG
jgi:hypothetical protein